MYRQARVVLLSPDYCQHLFVASRFVVDAKRQPFPWSGCGVYLKVTFIVGPTRLL